MVVVPTKIIRCVISRRWSWERRGERGVERDDERVRESLLTSFASRWISERMCSISAAREVDGAVPAEEGAETAATEGMATSILLSAISANLSRVVPSGVDASTILTFWGNLCKNNSRKNELSTPGRSPMSYQPQDGLQ